MGSSDEVLQALSFGYPIPGISHHMKLTMVGNLGDTVHLAGALARRGHDVRVFTADADTVSSSGDFDIEPIPVSATDGGRSEDLMPMIGEIGRHLVEAWRDERPDIVHCHGRTYGMAAQLAANRVPVPTVQSFRSVSATDRRPRGAQGGPNTAAKLEMLLARNATAVTGACNDDVRALIDRGCPRGKASVLPPGVEVNDVCADEIGSRGGSRVIAVARDCSPRQGLGQVLRALPALGSAELVMLTTDAATTHQSSELLSFAAKLGAGDRVRLIAGADYRTLTSEFRGGDVVVCPVPCEPTYGIALQAMACGLPVVGPAAGGLRDAVIADVTGLLVPPGNADALRRALRSILGQTVLRQGMGLAGRSRARSRYSWDRIATEAEAVFTSALTRHTSLAAAR